MNNYQFYLLAQSAGDVVKETAEETKSIISKITTAKVAQAVFILLAAYLILKILDKVIIWLSERIAKAWRLRVKQFLPFLRMMIFTATAVILMNLFLNLSKEIYFSCNRYSRSSFGFCF